MHDYNSPEILVSVLRSTSFLLEHYGYSGHDRGRYETQLRRCNDDAETLAHVLRS